MSSTQRALASRALSWVTAVPLRVSAGMLASLMLAVGLSGVASAQSQSEGRADSTLIGVRTMAPTVCPNLTADPARNFQWFGAPPPGYYKSISDGNCYPILPCAGGTWDAVAQTCICGGGTTFDGNNCVSSCSGGRIWDIMAATCVCPGGQFWDGSNCLSCAIGQVWNGAACVLTPPSLMATLNTSNGFVNTPYTVSWQTSDAATLTYSCQCLPPAVWDGVACTGAAPGVPPALLNAWFTPAAGQAGTPYLMEWNTTNATSVSFSCTGAWVGAGVLTPTAGGSIPGTIPFGVTTCSFTALSPGGSPTTTQTLVGSCPPGSSWNGTVCGVPVPPPPPPPAGAPSVTVTANPPTGNVGSSYTLDWTTIDATSLSFNCVGASPASGSLALVAGGSNMATFGFGVTNCTFQASGPGGTTSAAVTLTGTCPAGYAWTGSACVYVPDPAPAVFPFAPVCQDTQTWVRTSPTTGYFERFTPIFGRTFGVLTNHTTHLQAAHQWNGAAWVPSGGPVVLGSVLVGPGSFACP